MTRLMRGSYRRSEHFSPVVTSWMRTGGHINGVSLGIGRRGWYVGWLRATPCRHRRRTEDLQRRVDRTIAYLSELDGGPLDATTRAVVDATRRSLATRTSGR